jgi:two-component system nitrate/nitrite sensor histidine kinase NarX
MLAVGIGPAGARLLVQTAALTLAALSLTALFHRLNRRLRFVDHLREWAERMRGGDLSSKIPASAEPDLDEIIENINSLGSMLEKLALEADAHSQAQNVRLARKTQSLDILYEVAASLTRTGTLDEQLEGFLDTFIELVDARAATVHLLGDDGQIRLMASRRYTADSAGTGEWPAAQCPLCGWALDDGGVHILTGNLVCARRRGARTPGDHREIAVVPIKYQDRTLGMYTLYLHWPVAALGEDAHELLRSIGRHLGLAIEKARLDLNARRLAIMEERTTIGNELHDSLAQSLVSLQLQVKMLGESLYKKDLHAAQNEVRRVRAAIEEAHTSLRELLANFRSRMDERGLVPAIEDMVMRFQEETGIAAYFQNKCGEVVLGTAQEIQVFHIIQEALANIRKHSDAHTARILLRNDRPGSYHLLIEDDGLGMSSATPAQRGEHIGLSIMRERAERLQGTLQIESEPGEGTRVQLTFPSVPGKTTKLAAEG